MAQPEVYRITGAAKPHSDDLERRIGRYLISMAIRTVCVILAVLVPGPGRWLFAVGAVVLPYIAVVMANASGRPTEAAPPTADLDAQRTALPSSPVTPNGPSWEQARVYRADDDSDAGDDADGHPTGSGSTPKIIVSGEVTEVHSSRSAL